jgi:hypothetical protein
LKKLELQLMQARLQPTSENHGAQGQMYTMYYQINSEPHDASVDLKVRCPPPSEVTKTHKTTTIAEHDTSPLSRSDNAAHVAICVKPQIRVKTYTSISVDDHTASIAYETRKIAGHGIRELSISDVDHSVNSCRANEKSHKTTQIAGVDSTRKTDGTIVSEPHELRAKPDVSVDFKVHACSSHGTKGQAQDPGAQGQSTLYCPPSRLYNSVRFLTDEKSRLATAHNRSITFDCDPCVTTGRQPSAPCSPDDTRSTAHLINELPASDSQSTIEVSTGQQTVPAMSRMRNRCTTLSWAKIVMTLLLCMLTFFTTRIVYATPFSESLVQMGSFVDTTFGVSLSPGGLVLLSSKIQYVPVIIQIAKPLWQDDQQNTQNRTNDTKYNCKTDATGKNHCFLTSCGHENKMKELFHDIRRQIRNTYAEILDTRFTPLCYLNFALKIPFRVIQE